VESSDFPHAHLEAPISWGQEQKKNIDVPARVISVRPNSFGIAGGGGQSTHVVSIETTDQILDCFIDERSATLLLAISFYLNPFQLSGDLGTPSLDASKPRI
jgi:hypothetical protein